MEDVVCCFEARRRQRRQIILGKVEYGMEIVMERWTVFKSRDPTMASEVSTKSAPINVPVTCTTQRSNVLLNSLVLQSNYHVEDG